MKTSFKLAFFRYYYNNKHKGFAVPLAIGIGLSLLLVGTTLLLRSQSDTSKIAAQQAKTKGLSAAEVGVTRLQQLINENRILASYSSACATGSNNCWQQVVADSSSTSTSSTLPEFQQQLELAPSGICLDVPETAQQRKQRLDQIVRLTRADGNDLSTWEDLGNGNFYRLVNYTYESVSGNDKLLGKGILTVEGVSGIDNNQSRSRLRVEIPIKRGEKPPILKGDYAPGLWIKQGAIDKLTTLENATTTSIDKNGQKFESNILLNDCNLTQSLADSIKTLRIPSTSPYKEVERMIVKLPAAPTESEISSDLTVIKMSTPESGTKSADGYYDYPQSGEREKSVYKYLFDTIDLKGNTKVRITPGKKVIFYVKGNIDIGGDSAIEHDCTGNSSCKPTDFQIYGLATNPTPSDLTKDPFINLSGNGALEAFIFAPNYTAGVNGGGTRTLVPFKGSLWVKTWSKLSQVGSNSNDVALLQTAKWEDLPAGYQPSSITMPQLGSISSWREEPIN